jgi:membrane-bound metal-dependent hydrolase YbcI (DUF457 family)
MFIGHDAVGFASKRIAPRTSLGWLMTAPILLDLLWPLFLLIGIEHVRIAPGNTKFTPLDFCDYPWSHSLLMAIVWGVLFAAAYFAKTRYTAGALTLACGVVSHWLLDFFTHGADMPLYPGGPKVGLGLWNHPTATVIVEGAMFIAGLAIYVRATRPRDRTGLFAMWGLVITLILIYCANAQGPPPPNVGTLIVLAFAQYLIPIWAAWIDRHREARG